MWAEFWERPPIHTQHVIWEWIKKLWMYLCASSYWVMSAVGLFRLDWIGPSSTSDLGFVKQIMDLPPKKRCSYLGGNKNKLKKLDRNRSTFVKIWIVHLYSRMFHSQSGTVFVSRKFTFPWNHIRVPVENTAKL